MIRKLISFFTLIFIPCLFIAIFIGSCNICRDWLIDKEVVKIAGYTEKECLDLADKWSNTPEERVQARKEIKKVFNSNWLPWFEGDADLKRVSKKYGLLMDIR